MKVSALKLKEIYIESQKRLLAEIERRIQAGRSVFVQREMLKAVNREIARLNKLCGEWVKTNVPKMYAQAVKRTQSIIGTTQAVGAFLGLHTRAIKILANNTRDYLLINNNLVGRQTEDIIRKVSVEAATHHFAEGMTVKQTRAEVMQRLQTEGLFRVPIGGGRTMRLDSYAELVARTTTAEVENTATFNETLALGESLVKMSTHSTTCKICAARQGRVYRLLVLEKYPADDPRRNFPHISEALPQWPDYKTIHPNCGHAFFAFPWEMRTKKERERALADAQKPFDYDPRSEAERLRYEHGQKIKRERLRDRYQWEDFRAVLGDENVPRTFSAFRSIKKAGGQNYELLQVKYRAMQHYNKAVENEPAITKQVIGIAKNTKMQPTGLEYRIKGKKSYLRKIEGDFSKSGKYTEIKDIIRYTLTAEPEELVEKTKKTIELFEKDGYHTIRVKNTWLDEHNPYKGINTVLAAPNGQKFELQYHTPESFELKNGRMHELYEKQRLISDAESEEYIKLRKEMFALSNALTIPSNIEGVEQR